MRSVTLYPGLRRGEFSLTGITRRTGNFSQSLLTPIQYFTDVEVGSGESYKWKFCKNLETSRTFSSLMRLQRYDFSSIFFCITLQTSDCFSLYRPVEMDNLGGPEYTSSLISRDDSNV